MEGQTDGQTQHETPLAPRASARRWGLALTLTPAHQVQKHKRREAAAERSRGKVNLRWLACSIEIFLSVLNRRGRGGGVGERRRKERKKKNNNMKMDGPLVMQMKDNIIYKAEA